MDTIGQYNKGIAAILTPVLIGLAARYGLALDFNTTLAVVSLVTGAVVVWVRNEVKIDPAHLELAKKIVAALQEEAEK